MTTTQQMTVALDKLSLWKGNVRKTAVDTALDELVASIQAHGLLNPLTVRSTGKGRFAVLAGQRRLRALQSLAQRGELDRKAPVACTLAAHDQNATELSLAENVVRVAMHPADQFEAWAALIDHGASIAGIAERFGVAESTVAKRLALARVSPRLFALYRGGGLSLDVLQAFTVSGNHAAQEAVWDAAPDWQKTDARAIRRALTQAEVPTDDRRARFVTIEAYEAAGGTIRRDLFDPSGGGFVQDTVLLDRLVRDRLDVLAARVKLEGWLWAESRIRFEWDERCRFERGQAAMTDRSPEIEAEADALLEELDALDEGHDGGDESAERRQAIRDRLDAITARRIVWPDALKARGGAVVSLTYEGGVEITRGLIRPEDIEAWRRAETGGASENDAEVEGEREEAAPSPVLSASLIEELTAQKTAALRIETARQPDVALALTVHALAGEVFYPGASHGALKARVMFRSLEPSIRRFADCPAAQALEAERERIGSLLPASHADLWDWCLKSERTVLLDVLAVTVAHGIDGVQSKADANMAGRQHGAALAGALKLDMACWYRPTAEGYFGRVGKAQILADLEAAKGKPNAPSWAKLKKAELAALAEAETAQCGWLPPLLR